MTEQKVLLTWGSNWADEMDVDGFVITTSQQWEAYKKKLKEREKKFTISIGTNEDIYYSNGAELLAEISVTELSDLEVDLISKKIGTIFGFTQFFEAYVFEDDEDEAY